MRSFGKSAREPEPEPQIILQEKEPEPVDPDLNPPIEPDANGNVINPDVDLNLPNRNEVDGRLIWKTILPDGRVINGATGEPWTDEHSIALYGEDSIAREPEVPIYTEQELAEAVALLDQMKNRKSKR